MIRHLCIQSFSFSKIDVRASLSKMRRNPGDAYNAWSRNAFTSPAALVGESGKR